MNQIVDESWNNLQDFDELDPSLTGIYEPNVSEKNNCETKL